jgi:hypothetical protein
MSIENKSISTVQQLRQSCKMGYQRIQHLYISFRNSLQRAEVSCTAAHCQGFLPPKCHQSPPEWAPYHTGVVGPLAVFPQGLPAIRQPSHYCYITLRFIIIITKSYPHRTNLHNHLHLINSLSACPTQSVPGTLFHRNFLTKFCVHSWFPLLWYMSQPPPHIMWSSSLVFSSTLWSQTYSLSHWAWKQTEWKSLNNFLMY